MTAGGIIGGAAADAGRSGDDEAAGDLGFGGSPGLGVAALLSVSVLGMAVSLLGYGHSAGASLLCYG